MLSNINIKSTDYQSVKPFPYMKQDNFLNEKSAYLLQKEILNIPDCDWDRYNNPFEQKYTLRDKYNFPPNLKLLFEELQSINFVNELSNMCGYKLILDNTRNFWGVHKYDSGDKLDIHTDAGLHPVNNLKKQITLGIYLSNNWKKEYGCELEIWEGNKNSISKKIDSIEPYFNRLIIFTCNDYSWHGNPNPVKNLIRDSKRIFVTISYLSENFTDENKKVKAYFVSRPEDPIDKEKDKLRLLRADSKKYKEILNISKDTIINNKKILLFGGSGSLGNKFIEKYIKNNTIINYSRDECKHWKMSLKYKTDKLSFIIGDIRDYLRVENSILREQPNIIIIMAALKHIDRCEFAIDECVKTNFTGTMNILNAIESNMDRLLNLETIIFVSTDKACEPTNVYGMSKALSESAMIEKSLYCKKYKFVNIRYGNVLNSRGSIIPILHEKGLDPDVENFTLTHPEMTRFVMTLEQSVELIEHAILYGESGDTIIPELISMKLIDLMEIFSDKYKKSINITGMRPGEKMLESLISEIQSLRLIKKDNYMYIKPAYKNLLITDNIQNYNSKINPLNKQDLYNYLNKYNLL